MPGMVQCHYHVAYDNIGTLFDLDMKHPPTMLTLIAAKNAELLLRSGFTGAVGAGTLHNIDVTLKRAINKGLIPGPRFVACGRDVVTTGDSVDFHPSWWKLQMEGLGLICDGPDEFRKAVRDEIKQGVDIIKLYPTGGHGLAWPADVMTMTLDEMKSAADTAHERGKKIRGHIISKRGILAALEAKLDVIDHGDMMDEECIEGMVQQGTFVAPSLYFPYLMVEQKRRTGKAAFPGVDEMERGLEHSYRMVPQGARGWRQVADRRRFRHLRDAAWRLCEGTRSVRQRRRHPGPRRDRLGDAQRRRVARNEGRSWNYRSRQAGRLAGRQRRSGEGHHGASGSGKSRRDNEGRQIRRMPSEPGKGRRQGGLTAALLATLYLNQTAGARQTGGRLLSSS